MNAAAWVFLTALAAVSVLLTVAVGGNSDLARQLRDARREVVRLRRRSLRLVGTPVELAGLYASSCGCGHELRLHGDLGCAADPGCVCSRDPLMVAVDSGVVIPSPERVS